MRLADHPDVRRHKRRLKLASEPPQLDAATLRQIALDAGADDVGFVAIDRAELDDQREDILAAMPTAKTLVSFVIRMNREPIRSPARSISNLEFHETGEDINRAARHMIAELEKRGVRGINPAMGFPMEMHKWPNKMWVVSHKPVAVAAGLGVMGIHRNVIHPKFGNFVLLGTVVTDLELTEEGEPLDYNPCLSCKLCVAACPVGAIQSDGYFDFSACYTHNYREFMGGFVDYVETVAEAKDGVALREKVSDSESVSMWQSLSFGANYKAAYCISVCPAGEDVLAPFLDNRKQFLADVVAPLQKKVEPVYVSPDSDAEAWAKKRFPHKPIRSVGHGLRPDTIATFLGGLRLLFQRKKAGDLDATYHFTFTGDGAAADTTTEATVCIQNKSVTTRTGLVGEPDVHVTADAATWLRYLRKEGGIVWPVVTRKVKVKGPLALLERFEACFAT